MKVTLIFLVALIHESSHIIVFSRTYGDFTPSGVVKFEKTFSFVKSTGKSALLLHAGRAVPPPGKDMSRSLKLLALSLEALSRLGINYLNAGRYETAWNPDYLIHEASRRGISIISSCIQTYSNKPVFTEYATEEKEKVKILITGVSDRLSLHHPGLKLLSVKECGKKLLAIVKKENAAILLVLADARKRWLSKLFRYLKRTDITTLIFNAGERGFDYAPLQVVKNVYLIRTPGSWRYPSHVKLSEKITIAGEIPDVNLMSPEKGRGSFLKHTVLIPEVIKNIPENYAGWKKCSECHEKEASSWKNSFHAKSWISVKKIKRNKDPACGMCHLSGWAGGFRIPGNEFTSFFTGVECESCHGPGILHVEKKFPYPSEVNKKICYQCHREGYSRPLTSGAYISVH